MSRAVGRYYVRFDWRQKIGHKSYVALWKWTPATGWVGITGEGTPYFSADMQTPNQMTWYETNYKEWSGIAKTLRA